MWSLQEADYLREAAYLELFGQLLLEDNSFEVPTYFPKLSTDRILAMSYIESLPIEDMITAPQDTRDRLVQSLIELLLRELFVFGTMQTDPNFANYRYSSKLDKIVLLDFGASREVSREMSAAYKNIMQAALSGDTQASFDAAAAIGFISADMPAQYKTAILDIIDTALEPAGGGAGALASAARRYGFHSTQNWRHVYARYSLGCARECARIDAKICEWLSADFLFIA